MGTLGGWDLLFLILLFHSRSALLLSLAISCSNVGDAHKPWAMTRQLGVTSREAVNKKNSTDTLRGVRISVYTHMLFWSMIHIITCE